VADSSLLAKKNLIIAGDLNLTLSSEDVWGGTTSVGHSSSYFKSFFQEKNLIDLVPEKVLPTWKNGRTGVDQIAKRLDRFLILEEFLSGVGIYRSWVEYPYISDHAPILLQVELLLIFKAYPFKLNPQWIMDQEFVLMVQALWNNAKYLEEEGK
jgi:exonuclease III